MKPFLILLFASATLLFSCSKLNDLANYSPCSEQAFRDSVDIADKLKILKYAADSSLVLDSIPTGLYYHITTLGTGSNPNISSTVIVNYEGRLLNGTVFNETLGIPKSFKLDRLIKGWQDGVPLIKKGGKITLYIPSNLGYACEANTVPANSVLIYDIQLVDFE